MNVRPALLLVATMLSGCGGGDQESSASSPPPPWFESSAGTRGLRFEHDSGRGDGYLMPEIMCGGAALVDVDDDGDLDAYLVQAGGVETPRDARPPNRLFINDGAGGFTDVTDTSGAGDRGYGMGVACGDYDGDGRTDLYVTNAGGNTLLRNLGDARFDDTTAAAGVGDAGWGSSAAFVDYDADGDLDLFVCNYLDWSLDREKTCWSPIDGAEDYCSPQSYDAPAADVLYRNEGDGTFTDVSVPAGIAAAPGTGLGVVCGDFDGNGTADIFVANDGMADRLWSGRGDGTFTDEAVAAGISAFDQEGRAAAGMGVAAADFDADGDLDLLVCNLRNEPDTLLRNEGGWFANVTAVAGLGSVSRRFTRFGTALLDLDNDGALDLYQVNGRVSRHPDPWSDTDVYAEPNLLWRGAVGGRFTEVAPRGGTAETLVATSRAAAFGDIDNDGGIDILVVNMDAPPHLLRNVASGRGHWLLVSAREPSGRPALGATVTLHIGDRRLVGGSRAASSYQSSNDPRVHFGLGDSTRVDRVTVTWVDGSESVLDDVAVDRIVEMRRRP